VHFTSLSYILLLKETIQNRVRSLLGETLDVLARASQKMIKPDFMLDPSEPEIYTLAGKSVVVATVKPSHGPVY
jgi:hypothetical protein